MKTKTSPQFVRTRSKLKRHQPRGRLPPVQRKTLEKRTPASSPCRGSLLESWQRDAYRKKFRRISMEKVLHPHHEYKMVSTIENIDHAKGNLKLKAHSGELAIHFPPAVVRDLRVGQ